MRISWMQIIMIISIGLIMYGDIPRRIEGIRKYMEKKEKEREGER